MGCALNSFAYGHDQLSFSFPAEWHVDWIEPPFAAPAADPVAVVRDALVNPVDGISLSSAAGAKRVAIAINDKTRPVPHEYLLPPLLEKLEALGVDPLAIEFFIATGTHLPMPPDEFDRVLPAEILRRYRVVSHNINDTANIALLGKTSRGTPIQINRAFYQANVKIVVGNIEPHHFAGFSGGYKTAAIGLGGRESITYNHAMLVQPEANIARYADNPLRQDIEEMGERIGVQFALNALLNGNKEIVQAVFGGPRAVMRAGIPLSEQICQVNTPGLTPGEYDLVIASVGGAPKDINFYQSQKALTHAALFVRPGGVIVLIAECPEGSGNLGYEQFMQGIHSVDEVFTRFQERGFQVGPHKALQVARIARQARIVLLSSMPAQKVQDLLMTPASTPQEAIAAAEALLKSGEMPIPSAATRALRVALLPRATNTIPQFRL